MSEIDPYILDGEEFAITSEKTVCCDGGGGSLGHPLEYMAMPVGGATICKYCDRHYLHAANPRVEDVRSRGKRLSADGQLEAGSHAA